MTKQLLFWLLIVVAAPLWAGDDVHEPLFVENRFPPAAVCKPCHPDHYRQWSVSPHAYAQLSPVFNAMQGTITKLTNGTNSDFCVRCHTPIGSILGEKVFQSNAKRNPISREGITCVVCHRVNRAYGKINSRFAIVEGDIFHPIWGTHDGTGFGQLLADARLNLTTAPKGIGRPVHQVEKFFQLDQPGFCGTCHEVTVVSGFREIEAFSEYKNSPASERGASCQDCHMGKTPGVWTGNEITNYDDGPAAKLGDIGTPPRKLTNHTFAGPDYPIIHPGLFPHNPEAAKLATLDEWLTFDHTAGWGTDEFEDNVPEGMTFPKRWESVDDRYEAREILDQQEALLKEYWEQMAQLLRNGYRIGEIVTEQADQNGIRFKVEVKNATDGHNAPTSLAVVRLVFLSVTITDSQGAVVWKSGDLDPNGDLRDAHSAYVHNGILPRDGQLFNLQSKFITRNVKGGEREQVLPANFSVTPLPFSRPSTVATVLTGRPQDVRIHKLGIVPLGSRWAKYKVKGRALTGKGPYQANVKLVAAMFPVNLVNAVAGVGFDYGMSPRDVANQIVKRHLTLWEYEATIDTTKDKTQVVWQRRE